MERQEQVIRNVGDVAAGVAVIGVLSKIITAAAAVVSLVWTAMRIYEMVTGKAFHLTRFGMWLRAKLSV